MLLFDFLSFGCFAWVTRSETRDIETAMHCPLSFRGREKRYRPAVGMRLGQLLTSHGSMIHSSVWKFRTGPDRQMRSIREAPVYLAFYLPSGSGAYRQAQKQPRRIDTYRS
jgi:hypothetical protein